MNDRAPIIINNETYFFRDHGQFDLLRLRLLPELIERRRDAKTLRLWSAGCSSGEEAYSLAMLVDMLLPERERWNILIIGSDIDEAVLARARRGRYGQWSFRMAPPALKQRYFHRNNEEWILDRRIRSMVSFRASNLIGDAFPGAELQNMDLILCRNVFIYFSAAAVAAVADKLAATLNVGGYLMTAHTELVGHRVQNLQSRLFAEGVVYQRTSPMPAAVIPRPSGIAPPPVVVKSAPSAQRIAPPSAPRAEDLLAAAREFADRGEYKRAEQACRQVLSVVPLAPEPYFLLAQLAQLGGDFEQARQLLDKTLYLDHGNVAAILELAALCERTEKLPQAQTLRRAALDIVRKLPGDAVVEPYETTAAEMVRWLVQ
ncbi:MAG: CheR family methyltransferase [Sideroxyarcus sp.]